jgi:hypothetical protein
MARVAAGQLVVVQAKRLSDTTATNLFEHMPEAVSQALAVSKISSYEAYFIHSHRLLSP